MLQEMDFRFTQTSYSNLHSVIPYVASLTFPTALSSQWAPAILTSSLFLNILGMLHVPSSGYMLFLLFLVFFFFLTLFCRSLYLAICIYLCFHNFRILLNCDFFTKSSPDHFNKFSSPLLDTYILFVHLLFLHLFPFFSPHWNTSSMRAGTLPV